MTTVLALARDGTVFMAADSMTNVFDHPMPGAARKIMRLDAGGEQVLLGISGNAGMAGRIRPAWAAAEISLPPRDDDLQECAEEIANLVTQPILDAVMTDSDGQMDGHFLLALRGRLWTIFHHAAVPHLDGLGAVGTGEGPAIGALDALLARRVQPEKAVRLAAAIAISRDLWSGLPLQFEVLAPAS